MTNQTKYTRMSLALLAHLIINCQLSTARAQGTAFTYQGRLNTGANTASGSYDLAFTLFGTNVTGVAIAGPVTNSAIAVSNGLFTTAIDFGAGAFTSSGTNWLEIGVRTAGGGSFSTLTPRQQLTPTPYAITAENLAPVVQNNTISPGEYATVGGGIGNSSLGYGGTVAGGWDNSSSGTAATVGGGMSDHGTGDYSTVGGGTANTSSASEATVSGGENNISSGQYSTIAGGINNLSSGNSAAIGGGSQNIASAVGATVGGGFQNTNIIGSCCTIAGGSGNTAKGSGYASVCGGILNTASGYGSIAAGGELNIASGFNSFAAGNQAQALHDGSFVWNDDANGPFASTAVDQFAVHAGGGVRLVGNVTTGDISLSENGPYHNLSMSGGNSAGYLYGSYHSILGDGIHLGYNYYYDGAGAGHVINTGGGTSRITAEYGEIVLAVGGVNISPNTVRVDVTTAGVSVYGTFNNNSDRNAKRDFAPVRASQILEQVLRLPVSEWSYKDDAATRHIGPMAQDFSSVFHIGTDDKHIAPIDEGGVAFAAIQGLNQKLEQKETEITELKQQNELLVARLNELASAVKSLSEKK